MDVGIIDCLHNVGGVVTLFDIAEVDEAFVADWSCLITLRWSVKSPYSRCWLFHDRIFAARGQYRTLTLRSLQARQPPLDLRCARLAIGPSFADISDKSMFEKEKNQDLHEAEKVIGLI